MSEYRVGVITTHCYHNPQVIEIQYCKKYCCKAVHKVTSVSQSVRTQIHHNCIPVTSLLATNNTTVMLLVLAEWHYDASMQL